MNYSSDLKFFANFQPSASNFKSFSQSLEQFFLTVGQNNFGKKITNIFTGQLEDVVDAIENNLDHLGVFAAQ